MGERDRRLSEEQRRVRGSSQVVSYRLRRFHQVLAGKALVAHLSVSR